MSTYEHDRSFFFERLIRSPLFLFRHFSWLFHSVILKIAILLRIRYQPTNRGAKIFPKHLFKKRILSCFIWDDLLFTERLPRYSFLGDLSIPQNIELLKKNILFDEDIESIYAAHRWGWLLDFNNFSSHGLVENLKIIERWIECNSDKNECAWETYSSCERIANSLLYFSVLPRNDLGKINFKKYVDFLVSSVEWIYLNLEYYGEKRTNNHILNNGRALVMAGVVLGQQDLIDTGMEIFRSFLPQLISNKGFLRERSSHYQLIILNWLMDALKFIESNKTSAKEDVQFLKGYVEKVATASDFITSSDGSLLSTIGDISPDFSPSESTIRMTWLYPGIRKKKSNNFAICEIQDDWFKLSFEEDLILGNFIAGKFPQGFPTHGHNDFTSFIWNSGDKRILIDPGRFRYTADSVSISQVGAMGHNLPIINGFAPFCETLKPNGYLWPTPYAVANGEMFTVDDSIILLHDGFSRATPVQTHIRQIKLLKGSLEVSDTFSGNGEVEVLFNWHFDAGFQRFDNNAIAMISSNNSVAITLFDAVNQQTITAITYEVFQYEQSTIYGHRSDSFCLQVKLYLELSSKIITNFTIKQCVE